MMRMYGLARREERPQLRRGSAERFALREATL